MCGIAGFFCFGGSDHGRVAKYNKALLERQIASIRYRGPDAAGYFLQSGVGLAHARLSIIDISESANQPMSDSSSRFTVVFNGEIYNFQEIRGALSRSGVQFKTQSDTEVLVEGYARWGHKIVEKLRGMFAIAIFDRDRDELLLMRDRVGKKPLYYSVDGERLVFGSEIKAIICAPGFVREPDYDAIHEYLTYQYVPCPMTAFKGVHKLPQGSVARVTRSGNVHISSYFALPDPLAIGSVDEAGLCEELVSHFQEATRLRMISDVPLGAFLSGGVDSSAVVAMMAMVSDKPVRTFTIGFEEQAYDEREYARMVAQRYGTVHEEFEVQPKAADVLDMLVYHYGEPYADSSAIPTYYVSKIAREQVTVILSGDGGDESFLGYTRYLNCRKDDADTLASSQLIRRIAGLQTMLPDWAQSSSFARRVRNRLRLNFGARSSRYEQYIAYFSDASKEQLYAGSMRSYLARSALDRLDPLLDAAPTYALGAAWADVHTYLPDDLLVKVDVASMANSLEVRAPFLDQKLMAWAATIPEHLRFSGFETKSLLKKAMEPYLPHDLMYRPKMGFGVPIDSWLRGDLKELAADTLLGTTARQRGLFDPQEIQSLIDRHNAGENWAIRIWALLMLELWFVMWIDSDNPFAESGSRQALARCAGSELLFA